MADSQGQGTASVQVEQILQETEGDPAAQQERLASLVQSSAGDAAKLCKQIEADMKQIWTEALKCLEDALEINTPEGQHRNGALFQHLRTRILNKGNEKVRGLPTLMTDYFVKQLFQREVVRRVSVAQSYRIRKPAAETTAQ